MSWDFTAKMGVEHQTWGFTNQKWGISEAKEGYSIHPISLAGGFHSRYFSSMTIPTLYTVPLRFGKDDSVKTFGTFVQKLPDFDKLGGRLAGQMYNDVYRCINRICLQASVQGQSSCSLRSGESRGGDAPWSWASCHPTGREVPITY